MVGINPPIKIQDLEEPIYVAKPHGEFTTIPLNEPASSKIEDYDVTANTKLLDFITTNNIELKSARTTIIRSETLRIGDCDLFIVKGDTRGKRMRYKYIKGMEIKSLLLYSGGGSAGHYTALVKYGDVWYYTNSSGAIVENKGSFYFLGDTVEDILDKFGITGKIITLVLYFKQPVMM